jgi:hypothetical protein
MSAPAVPLPETTQLDISARQASMLAPRNSLSEIVVCDNFTRLHPSDRIPFPGDRKRRALKCLITSHFSFCMLKVLATDLRIHGLAKERTDFALYARSNKLDVLDSPASVPQTEEWSGVES